MLKKNNKDLKLSNYNYPLPQSKIAQTALKKRDNCKLLYYNNKTKETQNLIFKNIINYFQKNDVIVINNSKVKKTKLFGFKDTGSQTTFTLINEIKKTNQEKKIIKENLINNLKINNSFELKIKNIKIYKSFIHSKNPRKENLFTVTNQKTYKLIKNIIPIKRNKKIQNLLNHDKKENNFLFIKILKKYKKDFKIAIINPNFNTQKISEIINNIGSVTIPPYIKKELKKEDDYQTIYSNSKKQGSLACPTAGLHFSKELIDKLKKKGVKFAKVTLHVGLGTFEEVKKENLTNHIMHHETFEINEENAKIINNAKRLFAIGTTSIRALESSSKENKVIPTKSEKSTNLFIYPGYKFKLNYSGIITNFHLPKSTLMLLISAFITRKKLLELYNYAIEENYRFYSLGDAMFIKL